MARLSDVSPGDLITSQRQNDINDYINDGVEWIKTADIQLVATDTVPSTDLAKGRIYMDDSESKLKIYDGSAWGTVALTSADLLPDTDDSYNLGSATYQWKRLYLSDGITLAQTSTTGYAVNITRDLDAASTDSPVVNIIQDNASDDQNALYIRQDGTARCIQVDATNTDTGSIAVYVANTGQGSGNIVTWLGRNANQANGCNMFKRNLGSANTNGPIVYVYNENTGDDIASMYVATNSTSAPALFTYNTATTCRAEFANRLSTHGSFYFYRNLGSTDTGGSVVNIVQGNSADDQLALHVSQQATNDISAMRIDNASPRYGLEIYNTNASAGGALIRSYNGGNEYCLLGKPNSSTYGSFHFYRNLGSSSTNNAVVKIIQENTGDDQVTLHLKQAATSYGFINFEGSDRGAISSSTSSTASVRVELNGTVYRLALYADA